MQFSHLLGVVLRPCHTFANRDDVEGVHNTGELLDVFFGGVAYLAGIGIDKVHRLAEICEHDARAVEHHVTVRGAPCEEQGFGRT